LPFHIEDFLFPFSMALFIFFTGATQDQQDAMRAQNVNQKVETIRRDAPKIKRNAPCPCGSGKKYKQCHGKGK